MTLKEADQITLGEQEGVLREGLLNSRVMVFSCAAYRSMCDELYEQFQSGASVILYRMGKGYARKLVAVTPKFGSTGESAIDGFIRLARLSGWGDIHCKISNETSVDCIVHHSPFVLRRPDIGRTSCYFLSGVLATVASHIYAKKFEAQEIECETHGTSYCRFKVFQASDQATPSHVV
ncbi:MAG: V4R domain-containing protein [Nitrososphaerales archaeon]